MQIQLIYGSVFSAMVRWCIRNSERFTKVTCASGPNKLIQPSFSFFSIPVNEKLLRDNDRSKYRLR